jgi:hypothetical protein
MNEPREDLQAEQQAQEHDLEGLDARMALLLPLEDVAVALHAYERGYAQQLTETEQRSLRQAVQHLCMVMESLHNR